MVRSFSSKLSIGIYKEIVFASVCECDREIEYKETQESLRMSSSANYLTQREIDYAKQQHDAGRTWSSVAKEMGRNPDALRVAVKRGYPSKKKRSRTGLKGKDEKQDAAYVIKDYDIERKERCPGCGGMVYMPCVRCQVITFAGKCNGNKPL